MGYLTIWVVGFDVVLSLSVVCLVDLMEVIRVVVIWMETQKQNLFQNNII
jgi:hypothetical protein